MDKHLLLVEGTNDKWFFTVLLETIPSIQPTVYPPQDYSPNQSSGIDSLLRNLEIPLKFLDEEKCERLAIVVDADYEENNYGFSRRREQIKNLLENYGYNIPDTPSQYGKGELFEHNDGLAPIGLWVMPNHGNEGMLEDFLLPCIHEEPRQELLNIVNSSISSLEDQEQFKGIRFSSSHKSKVQLSTWLNWQKKPNNCRELGFACGLKNQWFDPEHENLINLKQWLKNVFTSSPNHK